MKEDSIFIERAVEIASEGISSGSGPFGAVITSGGNLIAESSNNVVRMHDPTAHAELLAIREASRKLANHDLSGCVLYTSCEPCPMCLGAIYWSGIKRVVFASDRNDAAEAGFNDKFIYTEMILPLPERSIEFIRMDVPSSREVFSRWKEFEDKVRY